MKIKNNPRQIKDIVKKLLKKAFFS